MTYPHGGASEIWRDNEGGSPHNPSKAEVRDWAQEVEKRDSGRVNVKSFGVLNEGTDTTTALQAVRDWVAGQAIKPTLVFPEGTYTYSESPNWAIEGLRVEFEGIVTLNYTGTGNAVEIDAGATERLFDVYFGYDNPPKITAGAGSGDGLFVRSIHQSKIGGNVRGCDGNAINVVFAVSTEFNVMSTVNEGPFSRQPTNGLVVTHRNAATERTSACIFKNPKFDGHQAKGLFLGGCILSQFIGGAMQANGSNGIEISEDSNYNTFHGTDAEQNTGQGLVDRGSFNVFKNVFSDTLCTFTATSRSPVVVGGTFDGVTIAGNGAVFHGTGFRSSGGVLTDIGTDTVMLGCFDIPSATVMTDKSKSLVLSDGLVVSSGDADLPNLSVAGGARQVRQLHFEISTGAWAAPAAVPGTVVKTFQAATGAQIGDIVVLNSVTDLGGNYVLHGNITAVDEVTIRITQVSGAAASPLPSGGTISAEVRGY